MGPSQFAFYGNVNEAISIILECGPIAWFACGVVDVDGNLTMRPPQIFWKLMDEIGVIGDGVTVRFKCEWERALI